MDQNPIICLVNGKCFVSATSLRRHLKRHAEKVHVCDVCGKSFARKDELKSHTATHVKEFLYVCEACGMCFPTRSSLYNHKVNIHNLQKYACDICEKKFVSNQNMLRHKKSHGDSAKEQYPTCEKHFSRLKDHTLKRSKKRTKQFTCKYGKKFLENKYLQEHVKYKHGQERYQCPKCSHVFAHRKSLISHKRQS